MVDRPRVTPCKTKKPSRWSPIGRPTPRSLSKKAFGRMVHGAQSAPIGELRSWHTGGLWILDEIRGLGRYSRVPYGKDQSNRRFYGRMRLHPMPRLAAGFVARSRWRQMGKPHRPSAIFQIHFQPDRTASRRCRMRGCRSQKVAKQMRRLRPATSQCLGVQDAEHNQRKSNQANRRRSGLVARTWLELGHVQIT